MSTWEVRHGDCRDVMRSLPPESVDAIVSDPPYGLSFMGKEWDHGVPGVEFWTEALRVAKPGAHLVAFGGTRTYHRLAVAIEDAGWEVRDCLSWLYGSGFPKSLAVDKAIDKMDATEEQMARRYRFTAWVVSTGLTAKVINECLTASDMGRHYTDVPPNGKQPAIMTLEHLDAVRHLIGEVPEWVERECAIRSVESKNFAEREVVGRREVNGEQGTAGGYQNGLASVRGADITTKREIDITAPATDAAKRWHGWGTALKPAWEPIILARKPLTGTVAANVTQYGTGAINVDGCRLSPVGKVLDKGRGRNELGQSAGWNGHENKNTPYDGTIGRWPANVCLDDDAAELLGEPSRFFYTAKVSRREREAGLDGMPERVAGGMSGTADGTLLTGSGNERNNRSTNHHPTVKPIALMRWLCRLVTPPGGLILDPFNGSGSTGCAAVLEGFRYLGAELEPEYVEIARRRIAYWEAQRAEPDLFG